MRGVLTVGMAALLLASCSSESTTTSSGPDPAQQFSQIYNVRQAAYDQASTALGKSPSAASRSELHAWFDSLSNAEYDFLEGMGKMTQQGTMTTMDQPGSMDWKITFPDNARLDAEALWRVSFQLATDEGAVALDMNESPIPDIDNRDIAKVNTELDGWKAAANKLRHDLGLPES